MENEALEKLKEGIQQSNEHIKKTTERLFEILQQSQERREKISGENYNKKANCIEWKKIEAELKLLRKELKEENKLTGKRIKLLENNKKKSTKA